MTKDGGTLVFPSTGLVYAVDHHHKYVTLQNPEKLTSFPSLATHIQTIAVFAMIHYTVTENY